MSYYKDIIDALDILIEYPDLIEYIKTFNSPDGFMYTTETDIKRKECANRLDELLNTDGKHTGSSWGTMLRGVQSVLNGINSREYMIYKNNEEQNVHQEFMYQLKQEKAQKEQAEQEQAEQEQAKQKQAKQEQAKQEQAKQEQAKQEQAKQEQHWQEQVEAQVQSQKDFEEQCQEQVEQWQAEQQNLAEQQEQWQAQVNEQHAKNLAEFELRVEKANKERAILYEADYKLHINANC